MSTARVYTPAEEELDTLEEVAEVAAIREALAEFEVSVEPATPIAVLKAKYEKLDSGA